MKRIIYTTPDGGVAILIPSYELPIEEVARKDVPSGMPYKIIDTADVPSDRTFRGAWESDMTDVDGYGADYGEGSKYAVIGYDENGAPILAESKISEEGTEYLVPMEAAA